MNVAYFTASCDSVADNTRFARQLELDYPILSDPGRKVAKAYGVINEKRRFPQRWTFTIGKDGKIQHIDKKVKSANHGKDVEAKLRELGLTTKTSK